jgi:hypothetical protein
MQSWRVRPWLVLLVAAGLAVLVPGLAMADNVVVTGNAIQIVGGSRTVTIPSGGSATVSYYIEATGNDGQQGCNASDGYAGDTDLLCREARSSVRGRRRSRRVRIP